ncbi:MAG TPA: hypothetical protein VL088_04180, partial [Pedobacter sp.]|nr:hypothetical protein [Pedobacter sp.]
TQLGGIKEWMEIRDLCEHQNLQFSSGGYSLFSSFLMTSANENSMIEYLYSIMFGLEKYFLIRPLWKNGRFILPEVPGLPIRIDWDYCYKEQKIVKEKLWKKQNVSRYRPIVSM